MKKQRIWFVHGKIVEKGFYCPFCDRHRTGRIIKELYRWRAVLSCGHVRAQLGLTLPFEELERKGYINQKGSEDPRFTARKKALFAGAMKQREEAIHRRWINEHLAGGKAML